MLFSPTFLRLWWPSAEGRYGAFPSIDSCHHGS
jgi:hypothetical protein